MRWFPDLANAAFCETVELRRKILELQSSRKSSVQRGLEPSNAEFIAALAAGNNSLNIVQVGCGISTIALAVAAQTTGGLFISIHTDESKQDIVRYHVNYLGLTASVQFLIASEPSSILLNKKNVDFAHFTGDPNDYIQSFDSLNLNHKAVIAADNALTEASNEYIRHVRQQPGVDSSTLPLARGIEVTKLVSWERFNAGRILYSGIGKDLIKERQRIHSGPSVWEETTFFTFLSADGQQSIIEKHMLFHLGETDSSAASKTSLSVSSIENDETLTSCSTHSSTLNVQSSNTYEPPSDAGPSQLPSHPTVENQCITNENAEDLSMNHDSVIHGSEIVLDSNPIFEVHFQNYSMDTKVTITGINQEMLLSDITTAFSEMGISIKTASIETRDNFIQDVFYVMDAKSEAPLHPSQWDCVRNRILGRISRSVK